MSTPKINRGYPEGYKMQPVGTQFRILSQYFTVLKEFNIDKSISQEPLPMLAEGYAVGIDFSLFSGYYEEAIKMVFEEIAKKRPFRNEIEEKMSPKYLRFGSHTEAMFEMVSEEQGECPVVIYPVQMGQMYADTTPRDVKKRKIRTNQFGLSTFLTATIILSNPKILESSEDLFICCIGDEYSPLGNYDFGSVPVFYIEDEVLVFDVIKSGINWNQSVGCPTGFFMPYVPENPDL